jgi:phytoene dehydrogenase-like protein
LAKRRINSFVTGRRGLPAHGAGALSEAFARRIKNVRFNVQVEKIKDGHLKTSAGKIDFESLIIATDANTAAQLLDIDEVPPMVGCTTWYHVPDSSPSAKAHLLLRWDAGWTSSKFDC